MPAFCATFAAEVAPPSPPPSPPPPRRQRAGDIAPIAQILDDLINDRPAVRARAAQVDAALGFRDTACAALEAALAGEEQLRSAVRGFAQAPAWSPTGSGRAVRYGDDCTTDQLWQRVVDTPTSVPTAFGGANREPTSPLERLIDARVRQDGALRGCAAGRRQDPDVSLADVEAVVGKARAKVADAVTAFKKEYQAAVLDPLLAKLRAAKLEAVQDLLAQPSSPSAAAWLPPAVGDDESVTA